MSTSQSENELQDGYLHVRAGFALQRTSLHAWCIANFVDPHNARKALLGKWTGEKASKLVTRIYSASGAEKSSCN